MVERVSEYQEDSYFVIEFDHGGRKAYANRREVSGSGPSRRRGTWTDSHQPSSATKFTSEEEARTTAKCFLKSEFASKKWRNIRRVRVVTVKILKRIVLVDGPDVYAPGLPLIDKIGVLDTTENKQ